MRRHQTIHKRRARKRVSSKSFDLQLTSMMDILVIILVFLLKSNAATTTTFSTLPGMQIPTSVSPDVPPDSLHVIVSAEAITFDNIEILRFEDKGEGKYVFRSTDLDEGGRRVPALFDALMKARERAEALRAKSTARDEKGNPLPFEGILAIQADKRVNYDTLRRVMYTAGAAGYKVFRFLAMKKET